jgi:hypothetical protein
MSGAVCFVQYMQLASHVNRLIIVLSDVSDCENSLKSSITIAMGVLRKKVRPAGYQFVEHIAVQTRRGIQYKEQVVKRSPVRQQASASPTKQTHIQTPPGSPGMSYEQSGSPFKRIRRLRLVKRVYHFVGVCK